MIKVCIKCNIEKKFIYFHKRKDSKDGYRNECKDCRLLKERLRYSKNPDKFKQYQKDNRERFRPIVIKNHKNNRDMRNFYQRRWNKNNKGKLNAMVAKREANKIKATPPWSELYKIKVLYVKAKWLESLTGLKYQVDHIVPLRSDKVCGLHVWENLQILEASINNKKSNKF